MVNVNDTNNTQGKLENAWENLYEAEIDDRDRQAIEEFVRFERHGNQNCKPNTRISDLGNLRRASERAETPLIEMTMSDIRVFLGKLTRPKSQGGYVWTPTVAVSSDINGRSPFSSTGSTESRATATSASSRISTFRPSAPDG